MSVLNCFLWKVTVLDLHYSKKALDLLANEIRVRPNGCVSDWLPILWLDLEKKND